MCEFPAQCVSTFYSWLSREVANRWSKSTLMASMTPQRALPLMTRLYAKESRDGGFQHITKQLIHDNVAEQVQQP